MPFPTVSEDVSAQNPYFIRKQAPFPGISFFVYKHEFHGTRFDDVPKNVTSRQLSQVDSPRKKKGMKKQQHVVDVEMADSMILVKNGDNFSKINIFQ